MIAMLRPEVPHAGFVGDGLLREVVVAKGEMVKASPALIDESGRQEEWDVVIAVCVFQNFVKSARSSAAPCPHVSLRHRSSACSPNCQR
eukprot:11740236-Alexandrium_andersonii.AAC.1